MLDQLLEEAPRLDRVSVRMVDCGPVLVGGLLFCFDEQKQGSGSVGALE